MELSIDNLSIYQIKIFRELSRCGSPKEASTSLGIPLPSFYKELKKIEKLVGTTLFAKDKKRLQLTTNGIEFSRFCQSTLEKINDLSFSEKNNSDEPIFLASTYGICELYLPEIISQFLSECPQKKFKIFAGTEYMNMDNRLCDIVIGPKINNSQHLSQTHLKDFNYFLYASKEYLKDPVSIKKLDELNDKKFILYDRQASSYCINFEEKNIIVETTSYRSLIEFAKKGLGIFPLTKEAFMEYLKNSDDFVKVLPDVVCEKEQYYFIHRKHSNKLELIDKLKKISIKTFSKELAT